MMINSNKLFKLKNIFIGNNRYISTTTTSNSNISSIFKDESLINTIEIKNLPVNITTNELIKQFGELKISKHGVKTVFDEDKGFAYITFETDKDYSLAIKKHTIQINNQNYNITAVPINNNNNNTTSKKSYLNHTAVTKRLWNDRENKSINPSLTSVPKLIDKTPNDSLIELELLFSSDLALREMYLSPYGHLRVGRLLEDLDALAAAVGFKHCENENDGYKKMVVTASIDRIKLLQPLVPDRDIKMQGRVTWVGRSSMEIMIKLWSKDNTTQHWEPILVAYFTMVAIDPMQSKSTPVNHLILKTSYEHMLFKQAEQHKLSRQSSSQQSLEKIPPTPSELLTIHNLFMITNKLTSISGGSGIGNNSNNNNNSVISNNYQFIPMKSTTIESVILCQPQEKNINGSIFGGYLLRKGFETAFTTAFMKFNESLPRFRAMDDISFLLPVEVGDILTLESTIVYSQPIEGQPQSYYAQVEVLAYVANPIIGEKKLTNVFNFTFYCSPLKKSTSNNNSNDNNVGTNTTTTNNGNEKIKQILPQTYSDAMKFISGKRIVERHCKSEQSDDNMKIWLNKNDSDN